ncbi:MAG: transcriptional regulator [Acidobacteriota bacterium]|nr:transcriptional regulator [Acidobacteriota bacterium]
MSREVRHLYEFDAFRLDPAERQLLRDGQPIALTSKVFETLVVLVERRGHLVEKEELMKLVWAEAFVEEANLARSVHTLRKALGEEHNGHKYIETVPKRGYRFVAEVRQVTNGGSTMATPDQVEAETRGRSDAAATQEIKLETPPDNNASANGFAPSPHPPLSPRRVAASVCLCSSFRSRSSWRRRPSALTFTSAAPAASPLTRPRLAPSRSYPSPTSALTRRWNTSRTG